MILIPLLHKKISGSFDKTFIMPYIIETEQPSQTAQGNPGQVLNASDTSSLPPSSSATAVRSTARPLLSDVRSSPISSGTNPIHLGLVLGTSIGGAILLTLILFFLCRWMGKQRRKMQQLEMLTPKTSTSTMHGIRANQRIEFVVPTITVSETTEESFSDADSSVFKSHSDGENGTPKRKYTMDRFRIDPQELQRGLYLGLEGDRPTRGLGKVGFCLQYCVSRSQLFVKVIGAMDLPPSFHKGTANPFVKVTLLPDKSPKFMTRVQRNTLNPLFGEVFSFGIKRDVLDLKTLKMAVWDYDKFSRKVMIGQVCYALKDAGITKDVTNDVTTEDIWMNLQMDPELTQERGGALLLALCYNPDTSNLTCTVMQARGLKMLEKDKDSSVYVKVSLYVRKRVVRTRKTPSRKKQPDVEFNDNFTIRVNPKVLSEVAVVFTLSSKCGFGSKNTIGRCQVGGECSSEEGVQHWQDMIMSPKSTATQWHILS